MLPINKYIPCLTGKNSDVLLICGSNLVLSKLTTCCLNYSSKCGSLQFCGSYFDTLLSFSRDMANMINCIRPLLTTLIVTLVSSAIIMPSPLQI